MKVEIDVSRFIDESDLDDIANLLTNQIVEKFDEYLYRRYGAGVDYSCELKIKDFVKKNMNIVAKASIRVNMKELEKICDIIKRL